MKRWWVVGPKHLQTENYWRSRYRRSLLFFNITCVYQSVLWVTSSSGKFHSIFHSILPINSIFQFETGAWALNTNYHDYGGWKDLHCSHWNEFRHEVLYLYLESVKTRVSKKSFLQLRYIFFTCYNLQMCLLQICVV